MNANNELKVGSEVYVYNSYGRGLITTIARETATRWVLPDGRQFNKSTLRKVGDIGGHSYLTVATDEIKAMLAERELRAKVLENLHRISNAKNATPTKVLARVLELSKELADLLESKELADLVE